MNDFEFIEHTADIGIRAYGDSYAELFENAARGIFSLIGAESGESDRERTVHLTAGSLEELLVCWLNELISLLFAERFLPTHCSVTIDDAGEEKTLLGHVQGCFFNPYTKEIEVEIKAVTYHNVRIEHGREGYTAEVIVDV